MIKIISLFTIALCKLPIDYKHSFDYKNHGADWKETSWPLCWNEIKATRSSPINVNSFKNHT